MLPHAAIATFLLRLLWLLLLWSWYHGPLDLVMLLLLVLLLVLLRVRLLLVLMLLLLMRSTRLATHHSIMLGHHGCWRGQLLR